MSEALEEELRDLFTQDGERAPRAVQLAQKAQEIVQRRRRRLAWSASVASVAAVVVASVGMSVAAAERTSSPPQAADARPVHRGALPDPPKVYCEDSYTPSAVTQMGFAVDGTVTSITAAGPTGSHEGNTVVLSVHEWFKGGPGDTFAVNMTVNPPTRESLDMPLIYEVGTRLLVSGKYVLDEGSVPQATVWGCGFTRYFDEPTAEEWRRAFSPGD